MSKVVMPLKPAFSSDLKKIERFKKKYSKTISLLAKNFESVRDQVRVIEELENMLDKKHHNDNYFYRTVKSDSDITGSKRKSRKSRKSKSRKSRKSKKSKSRKSKKSKRTKKNKRRKN